MNKIPNGQNPNRTKSIKNIEQNPELDKIPIFINFKNIQSGLKSVWTGL